MAAGDREAVDDPTEQRRADQRADERADDPAPVAVGQPDREVPEGEAHHHPSEHAHQRYLRPSAVASALAAVARLGRPLGLRIGAMPSFSATSGAGVTSSAGGARRRAAARAAAARLRGGCCGAVAGAPDPSRTVRAIGRRERRVDSGPERGACAPGAGASSSAGVREPLGQRRGAVAARRRRLLDLEVALHLLELGRRHAVRARARSAGRRAGRAAGSGSTSAPAVA